MIWVFAKSFFKQNLTLVERIKLINPNLGERDGGEGGIFSLVGFPLITQKP